MNSVLITYREWECHTCSLTITTRILHDSMHLPLFCSRCGHDGHWLDMGLDTVELEGGDDDEGTR